MPKRIADYQNIFDISALNKGGAFNGDFVSFPFMGLTCQPYLIRYRHNKWPKDKWPQLIRVEWTRCNFGGRRPWFICTFCEKRVGKLYEIMGGIACRTCANLGYKSQCLGKTNRRQRKAASLRRLMGDEGQPARDPVPLRLKGRHRKKYERQCERLTSIEADLDPGFRHNPRRTSRWQF